MKINAQEILLINKNMKFGENPTAPITKENVTQNSLVSAVLGNITSVV